MVMSYYKRLMGQAREGAPSYREANEDYIRMLDSQYGILGPLSDPRARHRR
jgi:hypothetical protein